MGRSQLVYSVLFVVLLFCRGDGFLAARSAPIGLGLLRVDRSYDQKTLVKKSTIPGSGNGLFAAVKISKGEIIGELGGRLVSADAVPENRHYLAAIPECARESTGPYRYIDSKDYGANVSRINFAPKKINGVDTQFQNAAIKQLCQHPYFIFIALRDIRPGEEIWSSYGASYDYDRFMRAPPVREFFCGLARIDCRQQYSYVW